MRLLNLVVLLATATSTVLAEPAATSPTLPVATGSNYECDAQNIVDACKSSIELQIKACGPNEWRCLCEQTNNLLTCYNNCPGHPDRFGVQQQKTSYCNAAGPLTSTSTTATTTVSTSTSTGGSGNSGTETGGAGESGSIQPTETPGVAGRVGVSTGLVGLVALGLVL